jgi:hypothetical protein
MNNEFEILPQKYIKDENLKKSVILSNPFQNNTMIKN